MPRSGHCSSAATKASEANLGEPDVSDQASQRRDETRRLDPPTPRCFVEPRSPVLLSDLLRQPSVLLTQLIGVLRAEVLLGEDGSHFEHLASAELGIGGAPLGPLEASSSELTSHSQKPAMISFDSVKGPSITEVDPFSNTT